MSLKKVYLLEDIIRTTTYGRTKNQKLKKLRQLKKNSSFLSNILIVFGLYGELKYTFTEQT